MSQKDKDIQLGGLEEAQSTDQIAIGDKETEEVPLATQEETIQETLPEKEQLLPDVEKTKPESHENPYLLPPPKRIRFCQLYKYTTPCQKAKMFFGSVGALVNGIMLPLVMILFGNVSTNMTSLEASSEVGKQSLIMLGLALGAFAFTVIMLTCWMSVGEEIAIQIRRDYFSAILRQNVGWFDTINPNELSSKVATDCLAIQSAIGERVAQLISSISLIVGGFVIGFFAGWKLAAVISAALPIMVLATYGFTVTMNDVSRIQSNAYAASGAIAEQAIQSVKTVKSLCGEEFEAGHYSDHLQKAYKETVHLGVKLGASLGGISLVIWCDYALGLWFGARLIYEEYSADPLCPKEGEWLESSTDRSQLCDSNQWKYSMATFLTVFYSILFSGLSLGSVAPSIPFFVKAVDAGSRIFQLLENEPIIKNDPTKHVFESINGGYEFKNIRFRYPMKQDIEILKGINLKLEQNQKTALVGESGCGKSTIMQLLQRFYDPLEGEILVDGVDLRDLYLSGYRQHIGYVGQEPVLFATTIRENLYYGLENATEEQMIEALKASKAWEFISKLPDRLDTDVGISGGQFSGGQKQRICIARAILRDPKILFLDEATSALDRRNEAAIQATLDHVSAGRTTIVIAHRLTTIMNSDKIIVLDQGHVVEEGTHKDLIAQGGIYEALAKNQQADDEEDQTLEVGHQFSMKWDSAQAFTQLGGFDQQQQQPSKKALVEETIEKVGQKRQFAIIKKLVKYNKQDCALLVITLIISLINGGIWPCTSLLVSAMIDTLSKPGLVTFDGTIYHSERLDEGTFKSDIQLYVLIFLLIALLTFVLNFLQQWAFVKMGESLTLRIRRDCFKKIVSMPGWWFDLPENNPGTIVARLAQDAQVVNTLASSVIGLLVQSFGAVLAGIVIAFISAWALTLVALLLMPLIVITGMISGKYTEKYAAATDEAYQQSGKFLQEAVTNVRTIKSFGQDERLETQLHDMLKGPEDLIVPKTRTTSLLSGLTQFTLFFIVALVFWVGAQFIHMPDLNMTPDQFFAAIFAILFAAQAAGQNNQYMGDVGSAVNAAKNIFKILESQDELQIEAARKGPKLETPIVGDIEFKNVFFTYPTRPDPILKGVSFKIKHGTKNAFVGPSGCGKSTIMQLLQRFYDFQEGEILIDGVDIYDYSVRFLRTQFGVVQQEPVVFNGTIRYNIVYNTEIDDDAKIRSAAERANALHFIENNDFQELPVKTEEKAKKGGKKNITAKKIKKDKKDKKGEEETKTMNSNAASGFNRQVGPKGSQISGGQKQRIAVARILLKVPKILLLDEATSALDSQNEAIVQASLDNIMKEGTSIAVAHRISTIKDSDQIFVMVNGRLKEQGVYQELVDKHGFFYRLERGGR